MAEEVKFSCAALSGRVVRSLGELDWSRCAIDSVSVRAAKGGH